MRVPRVYGCASDVYTWQNNCLNISEPQAGGGWDFQAHTGGRQMCIHGEIIT